VNDSEPDFDSVIASLQGGFAPSCARQLLSFPGRQPPLPDGDGVVGNHLNCHFATMGGTMLTKDVEHICACGITQLWSLQALARSSYNTI
jgi:hypothetical protein